MNEQTPIQNNTTIEPSKFGVLKGYLDKVGQFIKPFWETFKQTKFYTNKKIFYSIVGMFGLMFLIVILGLLFGGASKQTSPTKILSTPTPFINQALQTPTPSGDELSQTEQRLFDLKTQMDTLDVKQSRLQPPEVDFKISF